MIGRLRGYLRRPSVGSGASSRRSSKAKEGLNVSEDPFSLPPELFDYLLHKQHYGEVLASYRLRKNPLVLVSLVDGRPLVALHVVADSRVETALVASKDPGSFCALFKEEQQFQLHLTNLTDRVILFDIGGEKREKEADFWDQTDHTFWSGGHRNDRRLNRSNVLFPHTSVAVQENGLVWHERGENRRLKISAGTRGGREGRRGSDVQDAEGHSLYVYPKAGTPATAYFARTAWQFPEAVTMVVSRGVAEAEVDNMHFQRAPHPNVNVEDLLTQVGFKMDIFRELPEEIQAEVLQNAHARWRPAAWPTDNDPLSPCHEELPNDGEVQMANVVAGAQLPPRLGGMAVFLDRFDFDYCSTPAVLRMGVHPRLRILEPTSRMELLTACESEIMCRIQGRTAVLREEVERVYAHEECVICLGHSPDATVVPCGHRCVHAACIDQSLKSCPVCRKAVIAFLPE